MDARKYDVVNGFSSFFHEIKNQRQSQLDAHVTLKARFRAAMCHYRKDCPAEMGFCYAFFSAVVCIVCMHIDLMCKYFVAQQWLVADYLFAAKALTQSTTLVRPFGHSSRNQEGQILCSLPLHFLFPFACSSFRCMHNHFVISRRWLVAAATLSCYPCVGE